MNAQYQGSGIVAEYIIMYYTAHMHTPSLWQIQHNSVQPSLIADACIYCVLRHVHSIPLRSLDQLFCL